MEETLKRYFLQHVAQTSPEPFLFEVSRAEGIYLYDQNNQAYIDLISGIGVNNIGHCHPLVKAAIIEQLDKYWHTMVYGEHVQKIQVELAQKLISLLPFENGAVYFVNSGSEAVEGAMKLAKRVTGKYQIIAAKNAYHGSTQGSLSLMSESYYNSAYRPLLPGISFIDFNNIDSLKHINCRTAAVIVETVQGEAGCIAANIDFLKALRTKCTEMGALLIIDEIQCGFGRTGSFFAFESYNIAPDIVVMAKGMGGGMPIGAFAASGIHMSQLAVNPILGHITTFGGHPVNCAAALATIQVILNDKLIDQIKEKELQFRELLVHQKIKKIKGKGLLLAIELDNFEEVKKVIAASFQRGLITDWFLYDTNSVRLAPPLTITSEEINKVCSILLNAIDNL